MARGLLDVPYDGTTRDSPSPAALAKGRRLAGFFEEAVATVAPKFAGLILDGRTMGAFCAECEQWMIQTDRLDIAIDGDPPWRHLRVAVVAHAAGRVRVHLEAKTNAGSAWLAVLAFLAAIDSTPLRRARVLVDVVYDPSEISATAVAAAAQEAVDIGIHEAAPTGLHSLDDLPPESK